MRFSLAAMGIDNRWRCVPLPSHSLGDEMHTLRRFVNRVARDECGQDMVEYALILALVSIAAVGAVTVAGESIGSYWSKLSAKLAGINI